MKRSPMLRRNQSERSYTESVWLSPNTEEATISTSIDLSSPSNNSKKMDENNDSNFARRPPAPLMRRTSDKTNHTTWNLRPENADGDDQPSTHFLATPKNPSGLTLRR